MWEVNNGSKRRTPLKDDLTRNRDIPTRSTIVVKEVLMVEVGVESRRKKRSRYVKSS